METVEVLGCPYRPRVLDGVLQEALLTAGAVVIEGPRACGKTMTALNAARSWTFIDDPATTALIDLSPAALLVGERPRLLDEWQLAPALWNLVRREVDKATEPGQFILTGSAVPADDVTRHTGAGRFLRIRQRTMSWRERQASSGVVSLAALFEGEPAPASAPLLDFHGLVEQLCSSGFPGLAGLTPRRQSTLLRAYVDDVARADVQRVSSPAHAPAVLSGLIAALGRSSASPVTYRTLAADLASVAPKIKPETVSDYVETLERLFVVERQPAWTPKLTSRARLRSSPKLHLADPGLAAAALGATPSTLANEPTTVGLLFESAVFHDLSVYVGAMGGTVFHYRDSNDYEIDAVAVLPDGRWGAIEVKVGAHQIGVGAKSLSKAIAQVDARPPAFRLVLTGLGPSLSLDDGTQTCSLAHLGP